MHLLNWKKIGIRSVKHICKLINLNSLHIGSVYLLEHNKMSEECLQYISKLINLEYLSLCILY